MEEVTAIINLSERLTTIASFLPPGVFFADIGSDHAYLPSYVCQKDRYAMAIAGELNEGPYRKALETVKASQLENRIDVRLGNGLEVIREEQVTHVIIAGMGGALIKRILEDGKKNLQLIKRVIVQPNIAPDKVRRWLYQNGFKITNEKMIKENNLIYEIIVADKEDNVSPGKKITKEQLMFGPHLLRVKPDIFYEKWKLERNKLLCVINLVKQASVINEKKLTELNNKLKWIEEVLVDEEAD